MTKKLQFTMTKKLLTILLTVLTIVCFGLPPVAFAEAQTTEPPQLELIGTITTIAKSRWPFTRTPSFYLANTKKSNK